MATAAWVSGIDSYACCFLPSGQVQFLVESASDSIQIDLYVFPWL